MSDVSMPRVRECLDELRELDAQQRLARLEQIGDESSALRAEVESLLAHGDAPAAGLSGEALGGAGKMLAALAPTSDASNDSTMPERIADFRIVRQLGSGGMGVVYEAIQDHPRRAVALKLLRRERLSPDLLHRFRRETELLGRLTHPGIAKIYAAGIVEIDGAEQPYFAMELIDGEPLTTFARSLELGTNARLELMARICDAVQHAHQKGVIHRDLKPDNILVVKEETGVLGRPVVLDFGVARATNSDVMLTTLQTDVGQLVGTLPYMSPEQLGGDPSDLDTRSDVYTLGVLLFELLVDRLPHDLHGRSIPDAVLHMRDEDPRSLGSLDTKLRGDLDTIVEKALERDPERRYGSAADLASDIRRYLANEPVLARPASTLYQLDRFYRRNRVLVVSALTIAALTIVAVVLLARSTLRAQSAERESQVRFEEAEAIAEFYDGLLRTVRGSDAGPDVTVLQMLDEMTASIDSELPDTPVVRARVLFTIGTVYRALGQTEKSERFMQRSHDLRKQHLEPSDPVMVLTVVELGMAMSNNGEADRALKLLRDSIPVLGELGDEHQASVAAILVQIANALDNDPDRLDEAAEVYQQAVARLEGGIGFDTQIGATLSSNYALFLQGREQPAEAEAILLRGIAAAAPEPRIPRPHIVRMQCQLGALYTQLGRLDEAETLLVTGYEWTLENMGLNFVGTSMEAGNLASLYMLQGKWDSANELLETSAETLRELVGPAHRYTLRLEAKRVELRLEQGRYDDALQLLDSITPQAIAEHGADSPRVTAFREQRARALKR